MGVRYRPQGLSLAIGKTTKTYYAASEASGRLMRRRVGHADVMTAPEARRRAQELLVDLRAGIDPKRVATETLAAALDTYLARRRLKPPLRHVEPAWVKMAANRGSRERLAP